MSIFTCCTCPEPPGYDEGADDPLGVWLDACNCPAISILNYNSSSKTAQMCGRTDPDDDQLPKTVYKNGVQIGTSSGKQQWTYSRDGNGNCNLSNEDACFFAAGTGPEADRDFYLSISQSAISSDIYVKNTGFQGDATRLFAEGCFDVVQDGEFTLTNTLTYPSLISESCTYTTEEVAQGSATIDYKTSCDVECSESPRVIGKERTFSTTMSYDYTLRVWSGNGTLQTESIRDCYGLSNYSQSNPVIFRASRTSYTPFTGVGDPIPKFNPDEIDTDEDALEAATEVSGTSNSSIYELRTTSLSFERRTSSYNVSAINLTVGARYVGCVRIRRRESYAGIPPEGSNTDWEEVEPDVISAFTATATSMEIESDVALPIALGYEYEVAGQSIWLSSAGCECPVPDE
jgi:hypothetical protein